MIDVRGVYKVDKIQSQALSFSRTGQFLGKQDAVFSISMRKETSRWVLSVFSEGKEEDLYTRMILKSGDDCIPPSDHWTVKKACFEESWKIDSESDLSVDCHSSNHSRSITLP